MPTTKFKLPILKVILILICLYLVSYSSILTKDITEIRKSLVTNQEKTKKELNSIKIDNLGLRNGEWVEIVCYKEDPYTNPCNGMIISEYYNDKDIEFLQKINKEKVNYNFTTNIKDNIYSSTQVGVKKFKKLEEKIFSDEDNPKLIFWKIQILTDEELKQLT